MIVVPEIAVIVLTSFWTGSEPDGPMTILSPTYQSVAASTYIVLSPAVAYDDSLVHVVPGAVP